jgi:pimeloyl-ACP methyl ester carboxylesterase
MVGPIRSLFSGALIAWSLTTLAQTPAAPEATSAAPPPNDYSRAEHWLCRPGRTDACAVDISTTIVKANGTLSREAFKANPNAPIDCFYVYPTVSLDPTPNSDMVAGPEEKNVVRAQLARFASQCRVFAPLYRQVSLTALRAIIIGGQPMQADRALAYNDVLDAWKHYLANDNRGRGVVLIGHSQGSGVLSRLMAAEIDGRPIQAKLVSALLLGTNIAVPKDKDVGGTFKNIPLCRSQEQLGCALAYVSFRANLPPPSNTRFGKVAEEGMMAACVNPAALAGGSAPLHAYLANRAAGIVAMPDSLPWVTPPQRIETPFVSVPGLLSGACVADERGSYLAVKVNADPNDARTDEIAGDLVRDGKVAEDWGLHLIDVNVAMGDLIDLVAAQSKAYLHQQKSSRPLSRD